MSVRPGREIAPRCIALGLALAVAGCNGGPAASQGATQGQPSAIHATNGPTNPAVATARPPSPASSQPPVPLLGDLPQKELDKGTADRLEAALDAIVSAGAPDVVATVITADGAWSGAAGIGGPDGRPATAEDAFALASLTKPVLAALMLRLAELDKVDLDAPLDTYLPGLAAVTNGATVRQALEMRAGLGETDDHVINEALKDCGRKWTMAEVVAAFPAMAAAPGRIFKYSNPGYKLVGYAAERVTGGSLADAFRTYTIEPAGVERLVLQAPGSTIARPWALPIAGHLGRVAEADYGAGGALPCMSDATLSVGGSAMAGDAPSVARWAWQLFAGKIISPASLAAMTTVDADAYGLGIWRLSDFPPDLAFGHAGNKPGYAPILVVLPERQTVVVLCINDKDVDPYASVRMLLRALAAA